MLLHILRKDIREHRIAIAIVLIAIGALLSDSLVSGHAATLELLGMAAWAVLVARLVQSEAIPGDRQYWLTRPMPRAALLGAKVLGTVLFLHIPHLLADTLALTRFGFSPMEHFGGLVWKQFLAFAGWTLPLLAIATVTRTFAQYVLALLGIGVACILFSPLLWQFDFHWSGVHWAKGLMERLAAFGVGAAILWLQYFERRTLVSRILVGVGAGLIFVVAVFSPWSVAYAVQQRVAPARVDRGSLHVALDSIRRVPPEGLHFIQREEVTIMLPVEWGGLPEETELVSDRTVATIRLPNGEVIRPRPRSNLNWSWHSGRKWVSFPMREDLFQKVGTQAVDLDLRTFVTVYGSGRTYRIPATTSGQPVPQVGYCFTEARRNGFILSCRAALKNTALIMTRLSDRLPGDQAGWNRLSYEPSYTPLPTELSVGSPFRIASQFMQSVPVNNRTEVEFLVREPVGHLEMGMKLQGVKLGEYALKR